MKHPKTGRWDTEAKMIQKREDSLSYIIADEHSQTFIRGRRLIKPKPKQITSDRVLRSNQHKATEQHKDEPQQRRTPAKTLPPKDKTPYTKHLTGESHTYLSISSLQHIHHNGSSEVSTDPNQRQRHLHPQGRNDDAKRTF